MKYSCIIIGKAFPVVEPPKHWFFASSRSEQLCNITNSNTSVNRDTAGSIAVHTAQFGRSTIISPRSGCGETLESNKGREEARNAPIVLFIGRAWNHERGVRILNQDQVDLFSRRYVWQTNCLLEWTRVFTLPFRSFFYWQHATCLRNRPPELCFVAAWEDIGTFTHQVSSWNVAWHRQYQVISGFLLHYSSLIWHVKKFSLEGIEWTEIQVLAVVWNMLYALQV